MILDTCALRDPFDRFIIAAALRLRVPLGAPIAW